MINLLNLNLLVQCSVFFTAAAQLQDFPPRSPLQVSLRGNSNGNRDLLETGPNIARSFGMKDVLVVRIEASDSSTTATEEQLFNDVFDDEMNVSKQFKACSRGKFVLNPAQGKTITNGITTVVLDSVVDKTATETLDEIKQKAKGQFGKELLEFTLVMICMPPGAMKNRVAFALPNTPFTFYNDEWCSSVSAGMHQIGHSLGLNHAGEDIVEGEAVTVYRDTSGQMGFSDKTEFGPFKCFNPAKSWELGWYAEQSKRINPLIDAPFNTIMTGITRDINDYDRTKNILIQIPNGETNLYIGYNLADGYNSGTGKGQDNVLVTEQKVGRYHLSDLRAKLDINDSYKVNNYQGSGKNLVIQMNGRISNGDEAVVDIFFENDSSPNEPGCNDDQIRFEVNVVTDGYPADSKWDLVNDGKTVVSRSNFTKEASHDDLACIDREEEYTFTMYDSYKDGLCCTKGWGGYNVFLEGEEVFRGGEFSMASVSHKFKAEKRGPSTPAPAPTLAPSLPPTDTCEDDPSFKYMGIKTCSWIAQHTAKRCNLEWEDKLAKSTCPVTCGLCTITPVAPTVAPTKPTESCIDNADFRFENNKKRTCKKWVGKGKPKKVKKKCNKKWGKIEIYDWCPETCGKKVGVGKCAFLKDQ